MSKHHRADIEHSTHGLLGVPTILDGLANGVGRDAGDDEVADRERVAVEHDGSG